MTGRTLPGHLAMEQISVATGRSLTVLYRRYLGPASQMIGVPDPLALMADGTGRHWLLEGASAAEPATTTASTAGSIMAG
jgi:hypothetical protein